MQRQAQMPIRNAAADSAVEQIRDAFRPERKAKQGILLHGHRIKQLVTNAHYSFTEACQLLGVSQVDVRDALHWLIDDNARLNSTYDTSVHACEPLDWIMVGWFAEQQAERGA